MLTIKTRIRLHTEALEILDEMRACRVSMDAIAESLRGIPGQIKSCRDELEQDWDANQEELKELEKAYKAKREEIEII